CAGGEARSERGADDRFCSISRHGQAASQRRASCRGQHLVHNFWGALAPLSPATEGRDPDAAESTERILLALMDQSQVEGELCGHAIDSLAVSLRNPALCLRPLR